MGGAYKMGDVQCTHPRRTRGSSSNAREGTKGTEGRFQKLGRSIPPCFDSPSYFLSYLLLLLLFLPRLSSRALSSCIAASSSLFNFLVSPQKPICLSSPISQLHSLTLRIPSTTAIAVRRTIRPIEHRHRRHQEA